MRLAVTSTDTFDSYEEFCAEMQLQMADQPDTTLVLYAIDTGPASTIAQRYAIEHHVEFHTLTPKPDESTYQFVDRLVTAGAWTILIFNSETEDQPTIDRLESLMLWAMDADLRIWMIKVAMGKQDTPEYVPTTAYEMIP